MRFGKVIGKVVLNQYCDQLAGSRWLVVSPMGKAEFQNEDSYSNEPSTIVYDALGANEGSIIGFTEGGEATLPFDGPIPIDSYNAVIVDQIQIEAK